MEIFDEITESIRCFIESRKDILHVRNCDDVAIWPECDRGAIVLKPDTGTELGGPSTESLSLLLWDKNSSDITDNQISLIGPDIAIRPDPFPFARIVLVEIKDSDEENIYERYREMNLARFDLNLSGYMVKALPDQMREWSRISIDSLDDGCSLFMLGKAFIAMLKKFEYVVSVEVIYVTSSAEDLKELALHGEKAGRYINAMTKMSECMDFDCSGCDFLDICGDVSSLQAMRKKMQERSWKNSQ